MKKNVSEHFAGKVVFSFLPTGFDKSLVWHCGSRQLATGQWPSVAPCTWRNPKAVAKWPSWQWSALNLIGRKYVRSLSKLLLKGPHFYKSFLWAPSQTIYEITQEIWETLCPVCQVSRVRLTKLCFLKLKIVIINLLRLHDVIFFYNLHISAIRITCSSSLKYATVYWSLRYQKCLFMECAQSPVREQDDWTIVRLGLSNTHNKWNSAGDNSLC